MKRVLLWGGAAVVLFALVFFGLNLFDSKPAGGMPSAGDGSEPLAGNLEPGNGFFLIWGFAEAPETDPLTPAFRQQVLELLAARVGGPFSRSAYGRWLARLNQANARHWQGSSFLFPQVHEEDIADYFAVRRSQVAEYRRRFALLLLRFRQILDAGELKDFTPLNRECPSRSLQLATSAARLHAASQVLAALDGRWPEAENSLLAELEAGLRLVASGRTFKVNALGRAMAELALRCLASLLNRPECPPEMAARVLERLPDRPVGAFGTAQVRTFHWLSFQAALRQVKRDRVVDPTMLKDFFRHPAAFYALERFVALSGPSVFTFVHGLAAFFLKENETADMMRGFWEGIGRLEETPPWKRRGTASPSRRGGAGPGLDSPLWWLRNPLGKMMVRSSVPYNWPILRQYVNRSHELKARHDLVRLLARARLAAGHEGRLDEEALRRLLAAGERDPFSGSPYRFSRARGALYSVGADAVDGLGRERLEAWRDSDIAVPIRFVISDQ